MEEIYEKYGYTENQMCMLLQIAYVQVMDLKDAFILALGIGYFYPEEPWEQRIRRFTNWIQLYQIEDPRVMEKYQIARNVLIRDNPNYANIF